ncbi:MAG TPA: hypothetical protein VGR43_12065, partial [Dehalococcoidia bacterium]|nr:hypothetical protein [Dehalococcoidia bacterium]
MTTIMRLGFLAVGAAILALAGPTGGGPEDAAALRATTAQVHDGRENVGFLVVPVERVDPYVPDHYRLLDDDAGTTTVIVRTAEYRATTLGGEPGGRLRSAVVAVEIEPPDDNSGTVNWYILYWANDNSEFNRFLRGNTPSYPAVDVLGLTCTFIGAAGTHADDCVGETPGGIWQSQAPPPTPSPFDMTAVVTDSLVDLGDVVGRYWRDVPEGTVRISSAVAEGDSFVLGPSEITVTTPANTELAGILGGTTRVAELGISELTSGSYTRTLIDTNTLINSGAGTDNVCSSRERRALLMREQMRILALVRSYGPEASDLTTLRDQSDLVRLAQPDPEAGTVYNFYPHQFASFAGMGFAVLNTGELGPGKPDLLLYAPSPDKTDVTDPYGPDFPYTLAGWGYLSPYDHEEHPILLSPCIVRGDWFVHERGIHPADDWTMHAVPPHEVEHGQDPGQDPVLPTECQDICMAGIQHGRFWDIHFWLGDRGRPAVS